MFRPPTLALLTVVAAASACTAGLPESGAPMATVRPGGVTQVQPVCAGVGSCLLGRVVAAESAAPMVRAAVFLEREAGPGQPRPVRIQTLTDDNGVFTVVDAPAGRYRMAVYKDDRRLERRGITVGAPGTTLVPVRLPPS